MIDISNISGDRCALLIRHAEREEFPSGSFGNEITLTEKGHEDAVSFGRFLSRHRVNHIYCSPIIRCVQTAKGIVDGLGYSVDITLTSQLGNPGFHITDAAKAGPVYLNTCAQEVYRKYAAGERLEGFTSPEILKEKGLDYILNQTTGSGITLFISHDSLIAHLAYACGFADYSAKWVDYLDGIAVDCSDYSRDLMNLFTGYWSYLAVATACKVSLFDDIQSGYNSVNELLVLRGYDSRVLQPLLQALEDAGLIDRTEDRISLTKKGDLLTENAPQSLKYACTQWAAEHMRAWQSLEYTLKTGNAAFEKIYGQPFFDYISNSAERLESYHKAMFAYAERDYKDICKAVDFSGYDSIMDVGGSYGAAISTISQSFPNKKCYLFDLPEVAEKAKLQNVITIGGNFFESIPGLAQTMLLCRVLHDWNDEEAMTILRNCYRGLPSGGILYVIENCSDLINDNLALLSLNMAVVCHSFERTSLQYKELAERGGFSFIRTIRLNALQTIIEFRKP